MCSLEQEKRAFPGLEKNPSTNHGASAFIIGQFTSIIAAAVIVVLAAVTTVLLEVLAAVKSVVVGVVVLLV